MQAYTFVLKIKFSFIHKNKRYTGPMIPICHSTSPNLNTNRKCSGTRMKILACCDRSVWLFKYVIIVQSHSKLLLCWSHHGLNYQQNMINNGCFVSLWTIWCNSQNTNRNCSCPSNSLQAEKFFVRIKRSFFDGEQLVGHVPVWL